MPQATAQEKFEKIQAHLAARGNKLMVCTYTRATLYDHRHAEMFRVSGSSLYVQRGRAWDCIDYCALRFGRPAVTEVC